MVLLQFSAAQGPEECCLAVAKALKRLQVEAEAQTVRMTLLEQEDGPRPGTLRSALLSLEGATAEVLAAQWIGTLQWQATSPYRPRHQRKNWFIGVARCPEPAAGLAGEIRFETLRASGPGGQHVNRTESAVRATHLASGISVKVQSERSQHANKRLALGLIALKLEALAECDAAGARAARRLLHHQVERGNPGRVFVGERFEPLH
ncbi:peptide chain release factor H [Pseudomonas vanderleydeniana]|uniref:Peptide chain release factor H n=1 Tax=Pseudomonas vanderleydeniana TaxID=2745495 RepID=A0A9E6PIJ6_9PSED|nr:peptide chain release factor H [Pseudomonas vanderleydeniana]QXI27047.1 peptide chain release factor H [Pseudomonas vanderleydeniana]